MKPKTYLIVAFVPAVWLFCPIQLCLAGTYSGGSGTAGDPYQISAAADWQELTATSADWRKYFVLVSDIDLGGVELEMVGNIYDPFYGVFDGGGHVVRNAFVNCAGCVGVGLFGELHGQLHNLGVENITVTGGEIVGGLVGWNLGTLTGCYASGSVSGEEYVGGLVGQHEIGMISSCYANVSIVATKFAGGLIGVNRSSLIACYATGLIDGTTCVGGLVGANDFGDISDCFASGPANGGANCVGGLVGWNRHGTLIDCYAGGRVNGVQSVGGLVGVNDSGWISFCFAGGPTIAHTNELSFVGGLVGWNEGWLSSSYATGSVIGLSQIGGLVGRNDGSITDSSATGIVGDTVHGDKVGGLVGWNIGSVASCHSSGSVIGLSTIGGLVGANSGSVTNSSATGIVGDTVHGTEVGGLVGWNIGSVASCHSSSSVSGMGEAGGLVGYNQSGATITSCYSTGSATTSGRTIYSYAGGLVGDNYGDISVCYSTGRVTGTSKWGTDAGGLVGDNNRSISASFWNTQTSNQSYAVGSGSSGGTYGRTTEQMRRRGTFTAYSWDFIGESTNSTTDTWRMCVNDVSYPHLSWEFSHGGDFDCPDGVTMADLLYLASCWLATTPETIGSADANSDGKVDLLDLSVLSEYWLQ